MTKVKKLNTPNINTIPTKKRDFHEPYENQKPNSDKYRKGWLRIFGGPMRTIKEPHVKSEHVEKMKEAIKNAKSQ